MSLKDFSKRHQNLKVYLLHHSYKSYKLYNWVASVIHEKIEKKITINGLPSKIQKVLFTNISLKCLVLLLHKLKASCAQILHFSAHTVSYDASFLIKCQKIIDSSKKVHFRLLFMICFKKQTTRIFEESNLLFMI